MLVNLNTAVIGRRKGVPLEALADSAAEIAPGARRVWFPEGWRDTPIHRRGALPPGTALEGPAIVEQLDSTTVVEPGDRVTVDPLGNLIIDVSGGAA